MNRPQRWPTTAIGQGLRSPGRTRRLASGADAIHAAWSAAGAHIASPPQAQPYKLNEFFAQDPDGNVFRVFYDFGGEA